METVRKALLTVAVLGAGAGVGSILFAVVAPGELKKQSMLQEFPERDPQRRDEAFRTKELMMATLKDAATTNENMTWRKNWMVSGGGRSA
ncbi:ubiquinol-cytochrome-c reductase complex assembly factor 3 [Meriones unguiculatus]|uniref:ubiquinol-cytochrome-c reductase complex assembly factor 3 n=1 Tax=Meriones unguiculatus TaxID=10047 RepID=UPI000B4F4BD9|nr:ubiquinol-cytochrome-c reductase complex assembly factor 3 [Meriones unguiculatus]